ncbi:glycosyltransferase [Flavicella sp.]|uniref:glycosyltransferase n=1 Tax=Flavicella sp. TaxID=2957742 RepID=UPI003017FC47
MDKIYNFTNIASHYRSLLWQKLISESKFEYHFFFGRNKGLQIKEIDFKTEFFLRFKDRLHKINNFWLREKVLLWQSGVIIRCFKDEIHTAIFLGEFQVLSTWIAMFICKFRGIQVVYWTHGLYGNESTWKRIVRVLFYKTADKLLLYERRGKALLVEQGLNESKIEVIYNSLDYDTHLKLRDELKISNKIDTTLFDKELPYLIFIGRLTAVKKIELLIQVLANINRTEPKLNLLILGDGEIKSQLMELAEENKIAQYVNFYGACYDEELIGKYIYNSVLCVSPGNVGLTAIHSLSFGTPVCTHSNLCNQMPEVEVIQEGVTGCLFEENNIKSLEKSILNLVENDKDRETIRCNCYQVIDELYNPYNQLEVIKSLIK